jgi:hypothetical protein
VRLALWMRLSFTVCVLALSLLQGCGTQGQAGRGLTGDLREAALNSNFKLIPDEMVSLKGTALTVQLKSVRRTWYVDGKSETAEAELIFTLAGSEQRRWVKIGEKVEMGDYLVMLWAADPFGKTSCELIVTRGETLSLS